MTPVELRCDTVLMNPLAQIEFDGSVVFGCMGKFVELSRVSMLIGCNFPADRGYFVGQCPIMK